MTTEIDYTAVADSYLAAWNEADADKRAALLEDAFTADATYTDPLAAVAGRADIGAVIGAAREQFAGLVFSLGGAVDGHHDIARFQWHLGPQGGEALAIGFDVVVLDEDGRIKAVHGFLDKVPGGA
ncbi:MAG: nuclear transport factor 2 family protein [Catenulispora sp.]|nr:nuclear transport factor 2 family protein [Catenulispora sp.]